MKFQISVIVLFSFSLGAQSKECEPNQIFLNGDCFQTKHYKYMTLANAKGYSGNKCHQSPSAEKVSKCVEIAHTQVENGFSLILADRRKTLEGIQNSHRHRCSLNTGSVECIHLEESMQQQVDMIGVIQKKLDLMKEFPDQYKDIYKKCHFEHKCPSMGELIKGLPDGTPEELKGDLIVIKDSVQHHDMLEAHKLFGATGLNDEFHVDLAFMDKAFGPPAIGNWDTQVISANPGEGQGGDCQFSDENKESCYTPEGRKYVPETSSRSIIDFGRFFQFLGGENDRAPSEETTVQER